VAPGAHRFGEGRSLGALDPCHGNSCAHLREAETDGGTDTAVSAGDQRDLSGNSKDLVCEGHAHDCIPQRRTNAAGITLAMAGELTPILAAGAMVLSSLSVIGNSLRLSRHFASLPQGSRSAPRSGSDRNSGAFHPSKHTPFRRHRV
jgi:hypothetical protein